VRLIPKNWADFQHYKDRNPPWIRLHHKLLDNREFQKLPVQSRALAPMLWLLASESIDGIFDGSIEEIAFRLRSKESVIKEGLEPLLAAGFFGQLGGATESETGRELTSAQAKAKHNGFGSRHISDSTKRAVWERDFAKCRNCGATERLEYDHITPVSKGGNSNVENIQLLCRTCNRKKRTKTVEQFATPAQPWLELRTTETETETETEAETETDGGFNLFWSTYPSTQRKQAKGECLDVWKKASAERDVAVIVAHVDRLKKSTDWMKNNGEFIPAPLVYLNQKRWQGAEVETSTVSEFAGSI
jgi:5-methylcytosine-specific restriction endonuclease McrA